MNGGLPRNDVQVVVNNQSGRGSVSVVQQPSSYNNYTAVIRVYDPRPGLRWVQLRHWLSRQLLASLVSRELD